MSLCNACNVRLDGEADVREHYKSEVHALNLKRRVADLPPVTPAAYAKFVAEQAAKEAEKAAKEAAVLYICDACNKRFGSEGAFETHVRTKKHVAAVKELLAAKTAATAASKAGVAAAEATESSVVAGSTAAPSALGGVVESKSDDAEEAAIPSHRTRTLPSGAGAASSADEEEGEADDDSDAMVVSVQNCLFCFAHFENIEANAKHMREVHSFMIPDIEALTDLEGLLEHLLHKVVEGHCLFCKSGSTFSSPYAAQQHMIAKSHCKIDTDNDAVLEELSEFYDYGAGSEDDSDNEAAADAAAAEGRLIIPTRGGFAIESGAGELTLPSGRTVASRSYMRYYKQYYRNSGGEATRAQLERLRLDYESTGVVNATAYMVSRSAAMLSHGTRGNDADVRMQRKQERYRRHFELHIGLQMNEIRRKYFRVALLE